MRLQSVPVPPGVVMISPPATKRKRFKGAKQRPRCRMGPPSAAEDSSGVPRAGFDPLKTSPARKWRARGRIEQTLLDGVNGLRPNRPKTFARTPTLPQKVTNVSIHDKGPEPCTRIWETPTL
jgi:hypothetical protein